jgi:hypothetical protein
VEGKAERAAWRIRSWKLREKGAAVKSKEGTTAV